MLKKVNLSNMAIYGCGKQSFLIFELKLCNIGRRVVSGILNFAALFSRVKSSHENYKIHS